MSTISTIEKCINFICFPWKEKENTSTKIASWATFFFIGWLYHPFTAAHRCYKRLMNENKTHTIGKKILLKEHISATLSTFDNPHVNGQVNGIYITTNETNLAATRQLFKEHPRPSSEIQTIHIGCATWHNFDIMCERKSSYGLIIDFNPENAQFIKKTIDIIEASESREIFKQKVINYLNSLKGPKKDLFFHWDVKELPTARIEHELLREGSFLQTEESYLFIKELVSKGRLTAITEDITNFETFSNIRKFLDQNNIVIDTLYLSNICNFMKTENSKKSFVQSIKKILTTDTIFINCPKLKQLDTTHETILHQKPILGREVLTSSFDEKRIFEEVIP